MHENESTIGLLEARLRALETIIQNLPAVSQEVLEAAKHEIDTRRPYHPMESDEVGYDKRRELADHALAEIWRQKREGPAD
jgi:hypothetical protein